MSDHLFYFHDLYFLFKVDTVRINQKLVTLWC